MLERKYSLACIVRPYQKSCVCLFQTAILVVGVKSKQSQRGVGYSVALCLVRAHIFRLSLLECIQCDSNDLFLLMNPMWGFSRNVPNQVNIFQTYNLVIVTVPSLNLNKETWLKAFEDICCIFESDEWSHILEHCCFKTDSEKRCSRSWSVYVLFESKIKAKWAFKIAIKWLFLFCLNHLLD